MWIAQEPEAIAGALSRSGVLLEPGHLSLLQRDDRFVVRLPENRMAWFPTNVQGLERLRRERRVLALIGRHCAFDAPEVISESGDGWDVRRMVAGKFEPLRVYERVMREAGFARKVGERMGAVLACQHTAIPAVELADVGLPSKPSWPPPVAWAEERLPRATNDKSLVDRALRLLARYESEEARVTVRVLGHTDFGFHNIVIDATSGAVIGVFDYDSAAWCDPHHDFRYLLLDIEGEALLDGAAQVYEAATGVTLDRDRVRLLNAACAVAFLAFRAGSGPDEAPAGRTLAEDLRWTNLALRRAYA